jgi:hypothetical protein
MLIHLASAFPADSDNNCCDYGLWGLLIDIALQSRFLFGYFTTLSVLGYLMNLEQLDERELAWEIEVLWENLPQYHFVHHKSLMTWPGIKRGSPRREAGDYSLSYGTARYNRLIWKSFRPYGIARVGDMRNTKF